jgi:hypothetical protein
MTFFVDDVRTTAAGLDDAGFVTTGVDLSSPTWQEAFISPRSGFGTLLQYGA